MMGNNEKNEQAVQSSPHCHARLFLHQIQANLARVTEKDEGKLTILRKLVE